MIVTNISSPTVIASNVWAAATRNLTGFNGSMQAGFGSVHINISNGTSTTFNPGAASLSLVLIGNEATLNASFQYKIDNGTTQAVILTVASNTSGNLISPLQNFGFITLTNNGTAAGFYSITGISWLL